MYRTPTSHAITRISWALHTQVCKLADRLYGAKPESSPERTQLSKLVSISQLLHVCRCDRSNTLFRAQESWAQSAQDQLHYKPVTAVQHWSDTYKQAMHHPPRVLHLATLFDCILPACLPSHQSRCLGLVS